MSKNIESNAYYKCELCHEGFDGETNFNRHIESVHEGNKPYERNLLKAMHITNVNFVMKDLMGKQISTGILSQFIWEINHMKETI